MTNAKLGEQELSKILKTLGPKERLDHRLPGVPSPLQRDFSLCICCVCVCFPIKAFLHWLILSSESRTPSAATCSAQDFSCLLILPVEEETNPIKSTDVGNEF